MHVCNSFDRIRGGEAGGVSMAGGLFFTFATPFSTRLRPAYASEASSSSSSSSSSFIRHPRFSARLLRHGHANNSKKPSFRVLAALPDALLFDCDGVLVDTERDGHRISFNAAFAEKDLNVSWDVKLYGELLKIGGGKERMTAYFNQVGWPDAAPIDEPERKDFVASLHKRKTAIFMELIEKASLPLRPGVTGLIDEALAKDVKVAICSTSNEKSVSAIVNVLLGSQRAEYIAIFAGDIVPRKKPDPAIYIHAAATLKVDPARCVVIEDSAIGLAAAKAAGMKCIVTKSGYTAEEEFDGADAVFDCIGDPPLVNFNLEFCSKLLEVALNRIVA